MKYPTSLFLDEFTNFGKIANIANVLSIVRKAKLSLVLGFQNFFQLERVYSQKEAQIIFDQPATQIYFRQKNFREARALSEALGRTTIEEVTVSDTGRVHEFVQGRSLATPDELINLTGEVIAFTNDTWPLKIPLTSPVAYHHALAYPETIRKRGRTERQAAPETKQEAKPEGKNRNSDQNRNDRKRNSNQRGQQDRVHEDNTNHSQQQDSPEVDDVWPS
jgi:type IV secretory pathway TraG/TraD family ATPase VirD4